MPIYEYGCECGAKQERLELKAKKDPPECCGGPMEKLMSAGIFDLRGTGFYANDYGNGAHKLSRKDQHIRSRRDVRAIGKYIPRPSHSGLSQ